VLYSHAIGKGLQSYPELNSGAGREDEKALCPVRYGNHYIKALLCAFMHSFKNFRRGIQDAHPGIHHPDIIHIFIIGGGIG
jgi:hypothetical protein